MQYCTKCGTKVDEDISFCPKCGAAQNIDKSNAVPISSQPRSGYTSEKTEKREKEEKQEKNEKGEKTEDSEKGEHAFIGPLVGGLILIVFGFVWYLNIIGMFAQPELWALFFVLIGAIIIVGAIYALVVTSRRHPKP